MKLIAVLAALVALPVGASIGYVAHKAPPPPTWGRYAVDALNVRHVTGMDTDQWLAVATSGPHKNDAMPVEYALSGYPTQKLLERAAGGRVVYVEMKCGYYSTGHTRNFYTAPNAVHKCVSLTKTRKQAERWFIDSIRPQPKG